MDVDGLEFCAVSVLYKVITSVTGFIWIWSVHIALYVDVSNTIQQDISDDSEDNSDDKYILNVFHNPKTVV